MPDSWYRPVLQALPNPRLTTIALGSALGAGAIFGLLLGIVAPPSDAANTAVSAPPGVTSSAATAPAPGTTAAARTTASTTSTTSDAIRTVTGSAAAPQPGGLIDQPQNDPSLELVRLQDAQRTDHGVQIRVTRAKLLTGDAARAFLAQHGQQPQDVAVQDTNRASRFTVSDSALVFGRHALGQHDDAHQMGLDEFVGVAQEAFGRGDHPVVWVKHAFFVTGPVVYLAEQELP